MEKIIIYNVADARKIITMAANMRIKSIVIDNTKLSRYIRKCTGI